MDPTPNPLLLWDSLLVRQAICIGDDDDHDLSGRKPAPDHDVPDQAFPGFFLILRDVKGLHPAKDSIQNRLILLNPDHALCSADDGVCSPGIESGDQFAVLIPSDRIFRLVAVVKGRT